MVSRFFISHPIFAWILAIAIMLFGLVCLRSLPVSQYPDIAPPMVRVATVYPGATANVIENSVTQILEQELKGIHNLLYFTSTSSSSGEAEILLAFQQGTDPDAAQLQVQNKVNQMSYRLPRAVQQNGLNVTTLQNSFLMVAVFYDKSGKRSDTDIADWMNNHIIDSLSREPGVGTVRAFGSPYAMRIWLQPHKLNSFGLIPGDIINAIETQNTEVPVGELGARPSTDEQQLNVTVTALSRLKTPEEFRNIVIKARADGGVVRLGDVARVEIGNENYSTTSRLNGLPASGLAIMLAPGANALDTAKNVKARIQQLSRTFPGGIDVVYPEDATRFVKRSIHDVVKTLVEAVVLVVLVMLLFLQNWRTTLIPAITVPVVLLGTFGVLAVLGFSINTLTLFGMVLAIGLLVDDAIVVVENTQRIMAEKHVDAKTATQQSMREITSALIGITLVLGAFFLPMAFFPGSVGAIYRQFSITLVASMVLSALVALTLTPALCVALLKKDAELTSINNSVFANKFNHYFSRLLHKYQYIIAIIFARPFRFIVIYAAIILCVCLGYSRLPTAFIPEEDQGTVMVRYSLPQGATYARTAKVVKDIEHYFMTREKAVVDNIYTLSGFSFSGSGQNAGVAFVALKDWSERKGEERSAHAIAQRATQALNTLRDAKVFAMVLPPIDGLGEASGFELWLQDIAGIGHARLAEAALALTESLGNDPKIQYVDAEGNSPSPQLRIDIDQTKAVALGLDLNDVNNTLNAAWGGVYVNDFIHQGRIKKVMVQADAEYRSSPDNINEWFVRGSNGAMTPFAAIASHHWDSGPTQLRRFNGLPAIQIMGAGLPDIGSGVVMDEVEKQANTIADTQYQWSGLSYQEKISSGQAPLLYAISIVFVFLCLAALYESWVIPFSVLLVIPLGIAGAVTAAILIGLNRDIFFQVGMLTTMALSAKNAILIVEFAETSVAQGTDKLAAVIHAASQRLRPILMTSLAFGAGVLPLVFAQGPGAAAQNAIGISVLDGVITATVLAIFFVPLGYICLSKSFFKQQKTTRQNVLLTTTNSIQVQS